MAIVAPWSASLTRDDDKRDVVIDEGGDPSPITNYMKLHLGANALPDKRTAISGDIEALRRFMLRYIQGSYSGGNVMFVGPLYNCKDSTIVARAPAEPPEADDIAIVISATFVGDGTSTGAGSHFYNETSRQLSQVFLEHTKDQA